MENPTGEAPTPASAVAKLELNKRIARSRDGFGEQMTTGGQTSASMPLELTSDSCGRRFWSRSKSGATPSTRRGRGAASSRVHVVSKCVCVTAGLPLA